MSKHKYRTLARQATDRAKALLATDNDDQLRYAALELRLAMEALTYDRAQAYAREIPPEELATWRPDKVMRVLLEIEPTADRSYTLRIGEEPYPGGTPEKMHTLGTDRCSAWPIRKTSMRSSKSSTTSGIHITIWSRRRRDAWAVPQEEE